MPTKLAALALLTPTKFASLVLAECLILCLGRERITRSHSLIDAS